MTNNNEKPLLPRININKVLPKNPNDYKCSPSLEFEKRLP